MYYIFQIKFNANKNYASVESLNPASQPLPEPFMSFLMPCDGYQFQDLLEKVGSDVVKTTLKLNKKGKWIADIHKMRPAPRPMIVQFYDEISSILVGRVGGCTNYEAWVRDSETGDVFEYPLTDEGFVKAIEKLRKLYVKS